MRPQVSVGGLMKYLNAGASPARVGTVARSLREQLGQPYSPARDWWGAMRRAVLSDRRTTRDAQALRAAARNVKDPKKKPLYAAMAEEWQSVAPRWKRHEHVPISPVSVTVGTLDIRVSPTFAERNLNGVLEVVLVSFTEEKLSDDTVDAALRLMQRAYPNAVCTFVDLRRPGRIRTTRGRKLAKYDDWLESAGLYLAHVLAEAA